MDREKEQKNIKTISETQREDGRKENSFEKLTVVGKDFFKNLFKALEEVTNAEVIQEDQLL